VAPGWLGEAGRAQRQRGEEPTVRVLLAAVEPAQHRNPPFSCVWVTFSIAQAGPRPDLVHSNDGAIHE
jgi:hypothetical protein